MHLKLTPLEVCRLVKAWNSEAMQLPWEVYIPLMRAIEKAEDELATEE